MLICVPTAVESVDVIVHVGIVLRRKVCFLSGVVTMTSVR